MWENGPLGSATTARDVASVTGFMADCGMIPVKVMRVVLAQSSLSEGEERFRVARVAEGLIGRGHQVEIWTTPGSALAAEALRRGQRLRLLPLDRVTFSGIRAVRCALRDAVPHIVNTHCTPEAWLVALARSTMRVAPPAVHTFQAAAALPANRLARWLRARAMRHAIAADEQIRAQLLAPRGFREHRVVAIPDGGDALRFERVYGEVIERHARRRRGIKASWQRLLRSAARRWREIRLPGGYIRLGSRYGGWWLDRKLLGPDPLLVDCGLGRDISFDAAFLSRFAGMVVGVDPNPESLEWCREHCPPGMRLLDRALWTVPGRTLTFHLPRPREQLPRGADGVSGSLMGSHEYVAGGSSRAVITTDLEEILIDARRAECDVLKLDIEGAEYDVLPDLAARGLLLRCRQVLVEFHHQVTHHTQEETARAVAAVVGAGFRLVHVEGRNYTFRRGDLD